MKPFRRDESFQRYKGNLPHWNQDGATYFVTFRLADSIPQSALSDWLDDRREWIRRHGNDPAHFSTVSLSFDLKKEFNRKFGKRFQELLDAGHVSCLLQNSANASIVDDAFRFFHDKKYQLGSHVIMPNHVHVLLSPIAEQKLPRIMQSLKSFTAKKINEREGRSGRVWQVESYDHIVRSEKQLGHYQEYIRENPERANLSPGNYLLRM